MAGILIKGNGVVGVVGLDLYVYDGLGNLIAKDDDYSDGCYVEWAPRSTGSFTLRVVNHGPVHNDFEIVTN